MQCKERGRHHPPGELAMSVGRRKVYSVPCMCIPSSPFPGRRADCLLFRLVASPLLSLTSRSVVFLVLTSISSPATQYNARRQGAITATLDRSGNWPPAAGTAPATGDVRCEASSLGGTVPTKRPQHYPSLSAHFFAGRRQLEASSTRASQSQRALHLEDLQRHQIPSNPEQGGASPSFLIQGSSTPFTF